MPLFSPARRYSLSVTTTVRATMTCVVRDPTFEPSRVRAARASLEVGVPNNELALQPALVVSGDEDYVLVDEPRVA